jgi:hypothetical protein
MACGSQVHAAPAAWRECVISLTLHVSVGRLDQKRRLTRYRAWIYPAVTSDCHGLSSSRQREEMPRFSAVFLRNLNEKAQKRLAFVLLLPSLGFAAIDG